jgi:isoleucyl-tRNA synthetase
LMTFFVDDVSKWYVRSSRARFYGVESEDNRAAFATLHEVLVVTCRLLAPFAPFMSDWIHRELTGDSVHLARIQRPERWTREPGLEQGMAAVRTLATLGRAAREAAGIRVRQPLQRMVCVVPAAEAAALRPLVPLLEAELNVRQVEFLSSADSLVVLEARANFRTLGKKLGKDTKLAAAAIAALSGDALRAFERGEPLAVAVNNESRQLEAEDLIISRRATGDLVVQEASGYFAAIDPTVTSELRREGLARELISRIQRMRKEARLAVSDRIRLRIEGNEEVAEAVAAFRDRIAAEVLALEILQAGDDAGDHSAAQTVDLDGITARVAITRVD